MIGENECVLWCACRPMYVYLCWRDWICVVSSCLWVGQYGLYSLCGDILGWRWISALLKLHLWCAQPYFHLYISAGLNGVCLVLYWVQFDSFTDSYYIGDYVLCSTHNTMFVRWLVVVCRRGQMVANESWNEFGGACFFGPHKVRLSVTWAAPAVSIEGG